MGTFPYFLAPKPLVLHHSVGTRLTSRIAKRLSPQHWRAWRCPLVYGMQRGVDSMRWAALGGCTLSDNRAAATHIPAIVGEP